MRALDDIDLAGFAYLITEYETLIGTMESLPNHEQQIEEMTAKQAIVAGHWNRARDLKADLPRTIEDAKQYRQEHPGDTEAFIARSRFG